MHEAILLQSHISISNKLIQSGGSIISLKLELQSLKLNLCFETTRLPNKNIDYTSKIFSVINIACYVKVKHFITVTL